MKIAITGANGMLGRGFIEKYKEKHDLIPLVRTATDKTHRETDYTAKNLAEVFKNVDAIVHLASKRPYLSGSNYSGNLLLDMNILNAASSANVSNMVFMSSRGIYSGEQTPWIECLTKPSPKNLYSLAKYQSEISMEYFNRNKQANIKSLRLAQVLSHNEYDGSMISTFFNNASKNKPLKVEVHGLKREYIYIDDAIVAIEKAVLAENAKGIYNLGSGEQVTIETAARCIAKAFGNESLVHISDNPKFLNEDSLMNSDLFRERFQWAPKFTFQKACIDMAKKIGKK